jgi:molybdate transport system substrate-binding protein
MPTAETLTLLSSMATRELLAELAALDRGTDLTTIRCEATGGVDAAKRVQSGEILDIVVLAANAIDRLIAEGRLRSGSRIDLAQSGIAVAVRKGARRPDIGSEALLRAEVLAARSVGYSTGPSGAYLEKLFARWGIFEQLKPRIVVPPPGVPVGSLLAAGQCELGFQQLSELISLPGIEVAGPLPEEIQWMTVFSGAVAATSRHPAEAAAALEFFGDAHHDALRRRFGMDAVPGAH